jgi:hypothetical protein
MPTIETEITIPDSDKYFTKLPVFVDYQKITPDDLNLLSGTLQGDNPISMVLNLLRILSANYKINMYEISESNPYYDKQFISPIYSKPEVPVSIIGLDIDADLFSSTNKIFKIKPGIILFDYMAYTIPEFTVKASGKQGYIIAKFTEEDFGESFSEYYNLDEDKFIKAKKSNQKIYRVNLFDISVNLDALGNPIPPNTVVNSLPLFSYQEVNDKFIIRCLQSQTPLVMNPQYVTTKDILGDFANLGNFTLDGKTLTIVDYPPESKFIENGVEYTILRDSLDFTDLVKVGDVVRLQNEYYRKVMSVTTSTITIDKGLGMVSSNLQLDLIPLIGIKVEKALSLKHKIDSKYARLEIGDIKYKMDFRATSPEFPYLGLFSPTRLLNINNFPKLVPYLRNYRLQVPASVGYTQSNLASYIITSITRFGIDSMQRVSLNGTSNTLRIIFKNNEQNILVLKTLLDDELTRKFIDPAEFTPRTLTIGENCVIRTPFLQLNLTQVEVQSAVETFANKSCLDNLRLKAGTYSIKSIDVDAREIVIDTPSIQLATTISMGANEFLSFRKSYNDIIGGMNSTKIDITNDLIEFYPYRLPDGSVGTNLIKTVNTVKHFAIPGNGFVPRIVEGQSSTGGIEHIIGAVNGWDRYVIPGYAYLYAGEYLGG